MVTNYYNSSNNFTTPVRREPKPYGETFDKKEICTEKKVSADTDTIIILGLLAVLYLTNCRDKWLMLALLYLAFF